MVLDECVAAPASDGGRARRRWNVGALGAARADAAAAAARRCRVGAGGGRVTNPGQAQFGIIQGGTDPALRTESVAGDGRDRLRGYAIGGLSVGEPVDVMYEVVGHTAPQLPADRPRYLMGTGMPDDLVECVARGIDMFDCVLPTRNARNGQLLTRARRPGHQERPLCRGPAAAGPRLRLLHLPALQPRLPPPSIHGGRDDGGDPANTSITSTFTLTSCGGLGRLLCFGSFEKLRQEFHQTFSRRPQQSFQHPAA